MLWFHSPHHLLLDHTELRLDTVHQVWKHLGVNLTMYPQYSSQGVPTAVVVTMSRKWAIIHLTYMFQYWHPLQPPRLLKHGVLSIEVPVLLAAIISTSHLPMVDLIKLFVSGMTTTLHSANRMMLLKSHPILKHLQRHPSVSIMEDLFPGEVGALVWYRGIPLTKSSYDLHPCFICVKSRRKPEQLLTWRKTCLNVCYIVKVKNICTVRKPMSSHV